jgi:hypothetical protein
MSIPFGQGELGIIEGGNRRYQLEWEDLLWAARMLEGEAGSQASGVHGETILWSMTSRFVAVSAARYRTYRSLILAYSQPINPRWRRDGAFCRVGGSSHGEDRCSEARLQTRDVLATKPWDQFSPGIQDVVFRWATAQIQNPFPRAVHFAVPRVSASGIARHERDGVSDQGDNGWQFVWDSSGRTSIDPRAGGGNLFLSTNTSRGWDSRHVRIRLGDRIASDRDSAPTTEEQSQGGGRESRPLDSEGTTLRIPENRIIERISSITSDRTAPPDNQYEYLTVPTDYPDSQASRELSESEEENIVFTSAQRFKNQVSSLKRRTNLQITQTVPVILIQCEDEAGGVVNLNELIFTASPFEFDPVPGYDEFPERGLASIESFEVTVQEAAAGGVTGIMMGNLTIKVHNPSYITREHPRGKFISYLMQQGFVVRVRYGIEGGSGFEDPDARSAFQWREEDFFVSSFTCSIGNDLSVSLKVSLMPGTHRLLNQMKIGQSLPMTSLGRLSNEDLDSIVSSVVSSGENLEESQVEQLRNRLRSFEQQLNTNQRSVGVGMVEGRVEGTFGSHLHAALGNGEIFAQDESMSSIPVENFIEGIRGIQNILLTRRFEQLLRLDCYQRTARDITTSVVNLGPLIYNIAKPEIDYTFSTMSRNQIEIGEKFSSDSSDAAFEGNKRTNVKLVFGRFNSKAGANWANKPISSFPVNVETVFTHLRTSRNIGDFSSTINSFLNSAFRSVGEIENFDSDTSQGSDEVSRRLQIPQLKYSIYPSPENDTDWIMYVYDNKTQTVQVRDAIENLENNSNGPNRVRPSRDDIKRILEENSIPWLEMAEEGNFIRSFTGEAEADDLLASHNLLASARQSVSMRDMDNSIAWPTGISRDFLAATQTSQQTVISTRQYVPPIRVSVSSFVLPTAYLFCPVFIFFPIRMFSGIYLVTQVKHDLKNGSAATNLSLQLNLSVFNLMAL